MVKRVPEIIIAAALPILFQFPSSAHSFGAIAVDDSIKPPVFAIVTKQDSPGKAGNAAIGRCRSSGGRYCRIIENFDKCGAFATSSTAYGAGTGVRRKSARNMALRNCGENCEIVGVACEDD